MLGTGQIADDTKTSQTGRQAGTWVGRQAGRRTCDVLIRMNGQVALVKRQSARPMGRGGVVWACAVNRRRSGWIDEQSIRAGDAPWVVLGRRIVVHQHHGGPDLGATVVHPVQVSEHLHLAASVRDLS